MTWWPGWDSIDSAGFWRDFYFWFGIGCLFALGISEVISHKYGERRDELVAVREAQNANEAKRKQDEAETRRKTEVDRLQERLSNADKKVAALQEAQARYGPVRRDPDIARNGSRFSFPVSFHSLAISCCGRGISIPLSIDILTSPPVPRYLRETSRPVGSFSVRRSESV